MKKENFVKIMKRLIELKKVDDEFRSFTKKIDPDSYGCSFFNQYETLVTDMLKESMNDESDWIGYWLYDCDCGTDRKVNSVKDKNGKKIPLKTLSNLYDCIIKKY